MFTTGRVIFTILFVAAFVILLVWGYRKERKLNQIHFSRSWLILLGIIGIIILLFLIVKNR